MDLNVSPDIGALWCYLIVAILGAWVAVRQIQLRLGGIGGIWFHPKTWVLFAAYLSVPIVLFWLLDRTGATTDTSLFAAALVGVGYERIITGQTDTLRPPGDISRFWTPFLAYADSVARTVRERIARGQSRVDERVIAQIAASDQSFARFLALPVAALPMPPHSTGRLRPSTRRQPDRVPFMSASAKLG